MRLALTVATVCLVACGGALGYSRGAPEGACDVLEPVGHSGARRNPTPNPYSLMAPLTAEAGNPVTVTLSGGEFKGYMIQAITVTGDVVGQFQGPSVNCLHPQDTATHNNPDKQFQSSANLTWMPPAASSPGQIYFRGTVVRDYSSYYINIYSKPLVLS